MVFAHPDDLAASGPATASGSTSRPAAGDDIVRASAGSAWSAMTPRVDGRRLLPRDQRAGAPDSTANGSNTPTSKSVLVDDPRPRRRGCGVSAPAPDAAAFLAATETLGGPAAGPVAAGGRAAGRPSPRGRGRQGAPSHAAFARVLALAHAHVLRALCELEEAGLATVSGRDARTQRTRYAASPEGDALTEAALA